MIPSIIMKDLNAVHTSVRSEFIVSYYPYFSITVSSL